MGMGGIWYNMRMSKECENCVTLVGTCRSENAATAFDPVQMDYGALIPPAIRLPDCIEPDFVRWRLENYNGM